jgi:histidinol-phosphate phosphatase family protein
MPPAPPLGHPSRAEVAVVVPTVGRPSLGVLLGQLAADAVAAGLPVVVVDDRRQPDGPLDLGRGPLPRDLRVRRSGGRGPAAARNAGWRSVLARWVVFLDDDVELGGGWGHDLVGDLAVETDVVGVQGRIVVPSPPGRRPTDWERQTMGLGEARWATADMAYRRDVLVGVGGFDERFPRAYREDADLALRASGHGRLVVGRRAVVHPVRPAPWHVSVGRQRGNADDRLMDRIHGPGWRRRAGAPPGRLHRHAVVTAALAVGVGAAVTGRRRLASVVGVGWAVGTAELAWSRLVTGPRTPAEVGAMVATSAVIPPAATFWSLVGRVRRPAAPATPGAVLFDRDGTLVHDVPYNGSPDRVRPVDGAAAALVRLRSSGVRIGLVSNQSGVARGVISPTDVEACNRRLQELVGPFDALRWCAHGPEEGCGCRKPEPGLVLGAASDLAVDPADVVVVGDIGSDVEAAARAGARAVLVPTEVTRADEVADAPVVATDIEEAVAMILSGVV